MIYAFVDIYFECLSSDTWWDLRLTSKHEQIPCGTRTDFSGMENSIYFSTQEYLLLIFEPKKSVKVYILTITILSLQFVYEKLKNLPFLSTI